MLFKHRQARTFWQGMCPVRLNLIGCTYFKSTEKKQKKQTTTEFQKKRRKEKEEEEEEEEKL
jgi:hypothetical protein